jgi:hypothetical protein
MRSHTTPRRGPVDAVEAICIESRSDAINAKLLWGKGRLLTLDTETRKSVVSHLVAKFNEFAIRVPPILFSMLENPRDFDAEAADLNGLSAEYILAPEDAPDIRPTGNMEHDLGAA